MADKPRNITDYSEMLVALKQKIKWLDDECPHVMVACTPEYWEKFGAVATEIAALGIRLSVLADRAVAKLEHVQKTYEGK